MLITVLASRSTEYYPTKRHDPPSSPSTFSPLLVLLPPLHIMRQCSIADCVRSNRLAILKSDNPSTFFSLLRRSSASIPHGRRCFHASTRLDIIVVPIAAGKPTAIFSIRITLMCRSPCPASRREIHSSPSDRLVLSSPASFVSFPSEWKSALYVSRKFLGELNCRICS